MALRINLEIGHEASLRTKRTPEGYTHDWKVFVRGCDGADIHYYVEKVVFHLHETFQKPKRVVKEPPYAVKESGYAGFNLPIDIYLRNSGEPKKIKFNYDLHLQPSGPPLSKVQKEKYFFSSLPDDFKQKVIRGGGIMTNSSQESNESKSVLYEEKNQLISKPKFSGSDQPPKKPKTEPQISNSFQDLFGPPITKTTKVAVTKAPPPKENKTTPKAEKEKSVEKVKSKHSPHKDKEKERDKTEKKGKEEKKKDKEKKDKERERSREKSLKKEKSPKASPPSPRHQSPRPNSPPSVPYEQTATKHREKELKGDKERKEKPEKEEKKAKKEKKEKDHNRDKDKHRDSKNEHKEKKTKPKEMFPPPKQPTPSVSSVQQIKQEKKEVPKEEERTKLERLEKSEDKKHKHRKKDKNKKERDENDDKTHKPTKKTEKEKNSGVPVGVTAPTNTTNEREAVSDKNLFGSSPKTKPGPVVPSPKDKKINKLLNFVDEASDSSASSREQSPVPDTKKRDKKNKDEKHNIEKESEKKKKRKASSEQEQPAGKFIKEEENVKSAVSDVEMNNTNDTDMPEKVNSESEDYMNILRSLQHKIMALKENADLQKVVQLIAETGQYEISAHTFDFDLCLLDRSTVKQLQDFLSTIS